jgi:hypothetical protein
MPALRDAGVARSGDPAPLPPPSQCVPVDRICIPFELRFNASRSWPSGTYHFLIVIDDREPYSCSLTLDAASGSAQGSCNDFPSPVRIISYAYLNLNDSGYTVGISGIDFQTLLKHVHVELWMTEDAPRLLDVDHDLGTLDPPTPCNRCNVPVAAPFDVTVTAPAPGLPAPRDAGTRDAGDTGTGDEPRDASSPFASDAASDAAP